MGHLSSQQFQSPNHIDEADPMRLERKYDMMNAHGNHVQDSEAVYLDHLEIKGDLRYRRRLGLAQAIRAKPHVLLQYKR